MAYPTQDAALRRMDRVTTRDRRLHAERSIMRLRAMWSLTVSAIKSAIREEYRKTFRAGETWDLPMARVTGTMARIEKRVREQIERFKDNSFPFVAQSVKKAQKDHHLHLVWMLDQVTPPGIHPKMGGKMVKAREAGRGMGGSIRILTGEEAIGDFGKRYDAWLDAWEKTLNTNIALGAMNGSTPDDAADEVDVARPGSPANDFLSILDRMFRVAITNAEQAAYDDFSTENEELMADEIWTTEPGMSVSGTCPDCEQYEGMTREEVGEEEEPGLVHPNCHCHWRVVPREYAELMKMVNPEAAQAADTRGLAPGMMFVRDPETGAIRGYTSVDFTDWEGKLVATY